MSEISLLATMRMFVSGMRVGNEAGHQLAAFETIADEIDSWANRLEYLLADLKALVRYIHANKMCRKTDQRTKKGMYWFREWQDSWNALSRELRDAIESGE